MGTVTTTRPRRPTTVEDLHRLAELGRDRGLRLFEPAPNHWYCTSHSASFALHTLTAWSCDCRGFIAHGRCSHYALLLSELGWLPDPEPPTITCPRCQGCGLHYSRECERAGFPYPGCDVCNGTGKLSGERVAA
jgi:hypothetical protein